LFNLDATKAWATSTTWTHDGDGQLSDFKALNPTYGHGTADTANGQVLMTISTDPEGVCPVAKDDISLIIQPYPQFRLLGDPREACEPSLVTFESFVFKPYGSPNLKYLWEFGDGNTSVEPDPVNLYQNAKEAGYSVRLTINNQWGADESESCPTTIDSISYIQVHPMPKAAFVSNPEFFTTVAFPKFQFFNKSTIQYGTMDYLWTFGTDLPDDTGSIEKDPLYTYPADTVSYWVNLTVTSDHNCVDSIGQPREIRPDVTVFVPNAFSPERTGPGINNLFTAIVNGEKDFEIKVFNRWGEKMWETTDKMEGWDGSYLGNPCQQDVYMWVVKVHSYEGEEYEYSGTISLLR
jgi:gliding motility-associated-like protein